MADENLDPGGGGADAGGEAPAETSLHDDISQAFEQVETRDAPPDSGKPDIPRPDAGEPARQPSGERARGPDGRFLEQQKPPEKPPAKAAQAPQAAPPKPPGAPGLKPALEAPIKPPGEPQLRAPASWRPAIREHWGKLPAEVQQEVVRREVEVGRALQESAHARQGLAAVQQVLAPYANNIQASGTDALTAMNNFFQADHTLRHGSMQEKAQLIANVIKNYGVDVQALDTVLAGQPFQADPNSALADQLRREMAAQLQPMQTYFQQMQGRRAQAMQQIQHEAGSEVQSFGQDDKHEFFEDVRHDMADIMDLYTARGQTISLQEAYDRAIRLNPHTSEIVGKREVAERAQAAAQAAQRARRAAASIGGSPAPAGRPGPATDDRRAAIEAAWNDAEGQS